MQLSIEMIKSLKYKLWIFGIDITEDKMKGFGDNDFCNYKHVSLGIDFKEETPLNQLQLYPRER